MAICPDRRESEAENPVGDRIQDTSVTAENNGIDGSFECSHRTEAGLIFLPSERATAARISFQFSLVEAIMPSGPMTK